MHSEATNCVAASQRVHSMHTRSRVALGASISNSVGAHRVTLRQRNAISSKYSPSAQPGNGVVPTLGVGEGASAEDDALTVVDGVCSEGLGEGPGLDMDWDLNVELADGEAGALDSEPSALEKRLLLGARACDDAARDD